jgi:hypothetical protein
MKNGKSGFVLFLLILSAIIIGGFLGEFFKESSLLGFLSWGFPVGTMDSTGKLAPLAVDLKMIQFSLGLAVNINLASIAALAASIYIYIKVQ